MRIYPRAVPIRSLLYYISLFIILSSFLPDAEMTRQTESLYRERISIDEGWRFMRYTTEPDSLIYDRRPEVTNRNDNVVADTRANESAAILSSERGLKKWILPSGNDFIKDPAKQHQ